ncbi:predicted protein [Botrytis cinerea T4]|uniref:Uncharacterized protein n=1 Tax=Botryotinia fuckeliana (strain T4) TaxID=999810 RepID=G2Y277_BOTF4|nr:predicted protein [Botrytis cinerea T4]
MDLSTAQYRSTVEPNHALSHKMYIGTRSLHDFDQPRASRHSSGVVYRVTTTNLCACAVEDTGPS